MWAKSPVALQMGQVKDLRTGQVTRPEEFLTRWLLYWASASPLEWQNLQASKELQLIIGIGHSLDTSEDVTVSLPWLGRD